MGINTDELINILTQTPRGRRPMPLGVAAMIVAIGAALLTIAVLGLRPELAAVQPPASFWIKTMLLAAMLMLSLYALTEASKPLARPTLYWPVVVMSGVTAILVGNEWFTVGYREILGYFFMPNFPSCLICVTLYGAMGMVAFTIFMRRYAPYDAKRCAGLIGLAAAAAGALGYSIHCPLDSPTFIVVAYGLPMLGLGLIGRLVLPRYLQW